MSNKTILFTVFAIAALAFFYGVLKYPEIRDSYYGVPEISEQTAIHILTGDANGGGHKYGAGKPCKSEFPQHWDDDMIIDAVKKVAANDNLDWKKGDNGYYAADQEVNGVMVRVVLNGERSHIITSYPIGVERNDCPVKKPAERRRPANDNHHKKSPSSAENDDGDGYIIRQNFNNR